MASSGVIFFFFNMVICLDHIVYKIDPKIDPRPNLEKTGVNSDFFFSQLAAPQTMLVRAVTAAVWFR